MTRLLRRGVDALADPGVRASVVLVAVALTGLVVLGVAWHGVARTPYVPYQMPWLLSAGVAGLAITGAALMALTIHLGRRADATHRAAVEDVVRTSIRLADDVRAGRRTLSSRKNQP